MVYLAGAGETLLNYFYNVGTIIYNELCFFFLTSVVSI